MHGNKPLSRVYVGYFIILFGLCNISWQLLYLKQIQFFDFLVNGNTAWSFWDYIKQFPYSISLSISAIMVIIGLTFVIKNNKQINEGEKQRKE